MRAPQCVNLNRDFLSFVLFSVQAAALSEQAVPRLYRSFSLVDELRLSQPLMGSSLRGWETTGPGT